MPGLGIQIRTLGNTASPAIAALVAGLDPAVLRPIVGRSARNVYREHLFGLNASRPNRLGGARTNFYAAAARATSFQIVGDAVVISIAQVGIAQRYFGGTIRPRTKKYLTIPAIPEAYGKRASEFDGLHFALEKDPTTGVLRPCLVQGERSILRIRRGKKGARASFGGVQARRIVFWLVRSVTQQPDPSVLPYDELVEARVQRDLTAHVQRIIERRQPPGGDN